MSGGDGNNGGERRKGSVKWLDTSKGFGFITATKVVMISSFTSPPSDLRVTVTLPRRNPLSSRSRSTTADVTRLSKSPDQTALRFRVAAAVHREDEAVLAAVEEVEDEDEVMVVVVADVRKFD